MARVVVARVQREFSVKEIAEEVEPRSTRPLDVNFGDRHAQYVTRLGGAPRTTVIDTFEDFVLLTSARNRRIALLVAEPNVR